MVCLWRKLLFIFMKFEVASVTWRILFLLHRIIEKALRWFFFAVVNVSVTDQRPFPFAACSVLAHPFAPFPDSTPFLGAFQSSKCSSTNGCVCVSREHHATNCGFTRTRGSSRTTRAVFRLRKKEWSWTPKQSAGNDQVRKLTPTTHNRPPAPKAQEHSPTKKKTRKQWKCSWPSPRHLREVHKKCMSRTTRQRHGHSH